MFPEEPFSDRREWTLTMELRWNLEGELEQKYIKEIKGYGTTFIEEYWALVPTQR